MMQLPGQGRVIQSSENQTNLPGQGRLIPSQEEEQKEDWEGWLKRLSSQGASSVLERLGGLQGDIREGLGGMAINAYENFGWGLSEKQMKDFVEKWETNPEKQREAPQWLKDVFLGQPAFKQQLPPTSHELRKNIAKATEGYTEPKNWLEEKFRNFIGDITDLSFPGNKMSLGRKVFVAGASEGLGDVAQAISGKEEDKYKVKTGVLLPLTLINPGGAERHISGMYQDVRNSVPANAQTNGLNYVNAVNQFENNLMQSGMSTPIKDAILTPLNQMKNKIISNNGQISVHGLLNSKKELNDLRKKYYAETGHFADRAEARKLFNEGMTFIDDAIEKSLNQVDPSGALSTKFNDANQSWSTLHNAKRVTKVIEKNMPKSMRGTILGVFLEQGFQHPGAMMKLGGLGIAGLGIMSGARVLHQIMNSPTLKKYYTESLKAAAQGNAKLTTTMLSKLHEEWEKEETKNRNNQMNRSKTNKQVTAQ